MKKLVFTVLLLPIGMVHAGLFVMIESPHVAQLVQANKELIEQEVEDLNAQAQEEDSDREYAFEPDKWGAHITLAFVDQDPTLKAEDAEEKYPKLGYYLRHVAKQTSPINITDNIEESVIAYWPGATPMMLGNSKKKNYVTVVLKLGPNEELSDLAELVTRQLEVAYSIKQRFPFSAHLTLGRLYEVHDAPVAAIAKELTTEPIVGQPLTKVMAHAFKLKGAGGSEIVFSFGPKRMMQRHQKPAEWYVR